MTVQQIPFDVLAAFCAAVAATCLFLGIVSLIEQIQVEREHPEDVKRLPILIKIFLPFTPNLRFIVRNPVFDDVRNRFQDQLLMCGYDQTITPEQFLASRLLLGVTGVLMMFGLAYLEQPLAGFLLFGCLIVYPGVWLKTTVARRHLAIQKALPTVLDLLTLSIEAGKDFITALRDILGRRRRDPLGEELGRTLQEIQLGKQRRHALKDLTRRVQQPDLTSVINSIIQADELGVSIGQLLRIQGDQLRNKRFQRAEKLANEAPVKILFPVVVFIFPSVIIILMGPIVMQAFRTLLK